MQKSDTRATKITSPEVLKRKIEHYCAYQERCQQEVRNKLYELGGYTSDIEQIITQLIEANFLNEERFAIAYAGGKFRIKQWGKVKIIKELKFRKISPYCIKKAIQQIDDDSYVKTLLAIIIKKNKHYLKLSSAEKYKLANFAISKGFESRLVWDIINNKHSS
jgi:regulatory protein